MADDNRWGRDDRYRSGNDDRDQRYGARSPDYDRDRGYGQRGAGGYGGFATGSSRGGYGDNRYESRGDDDRGFFDRAADEVRSWFGDDDADRRRHIDARNDPQRTWHYDNPSQTGSGFGNQTGGQFGGRSAYNRPDQSRSASSSQSIYDRNDAAPNRSLHDDDYRSWRDRQMEAFDRDYHEYRQHRQSQFHTEFDDWRNNRATQAGSVATGSQWATKVREHQEVLGSDGQKVGTVDHVRGDQIQLTKDGGTEHHYIPLTSVVSVDTAVRLNVAADEARRTWRGEGSTR